MPDGSPGRDDLASRLQQLRGSAGQPSTRDLAAALSTTGPPVSQSTVARALSGRTAPDTDLVRRIADELLRRAGTNATDHTTRLEEILALATAVRRTTRRLVLGRDLTAAQARIGRYERSATHVRAVAVTTLPGWLQTQAYIRAVMDGDERATAQRLRNQRTLDQPDRDWTAIIGQPALGWSRLPPDQMADQLDHIAHRSTHPRQHVGIIPWGTQLPTLPPHSWTLYDSHLLVIGGLSWALDLTDTDDITTYRELTEQLAAHAVWDADARAHLTDAANHYRTMPGPRDT